MTQSGETDTRPPAPWDEVAPGLTSGDSMAMAAILQGDAWKARKLGFEDVARAKEAAAALLERLGTGLSRLDRSDSP